MKKKRGLILYRGTPYPEDFPELIDYWGVFFETDAYSAANYGDYVQSYDVGTPQLLDLESRLGRSVVKSFIDTRTYPMQDDITAFHEIGIHPPYDWVKYLIDNGYDGYHFELGVCLFEQYIEGLPVRFISRQKLEVR